MKEIQFFHLINIIYGCLYIKKNKKKNIYLNNNSIKKIEKRNKTLFVCTHDYCFVDIITSCIISIQTQLFKNTYVVVRESFISSFGKILPGTKMIEKNQNTTNNIIEQLKNNNNVLIFYSRNHIQHLNIHKIIKEIDIDIIPIRICSNTIKPISHNIDGFLENISIYLKNDFYVEIIDKIDYEKHFTKQDFVDILKKILYPDGGYFDKKDNFVKKEIKINNSKIIKI